MIEQDQVQTFPPLSAEKVLPQQLPTLTEVLGKFR